MGPAGVLAIPSEIPRQEVESMITEAQTFAGEWLELRAVIRNRLIGHCLQAPLQVYSPSSQVMKLTQIATGIMHRCV